MAAEPLPEFAEFVAPAAWRSIDFISDLHLAQGTSRTFDVWASYMRSTSADAVFILGDLFEVWIGDDTRGRPFEHRCVEVLYDAGRRRHVAFMAGNRDFLVGPRMLADCGVARLDDPTVLHAFGRSWLLTHGDSLCLDDVEYQTFRREVRSQDWQAAFLSHAEAERARMARAIRTESQSRKDHSDSATVWADVDGPAALAWLQAAGCDTMIHGHTHRPGTSQLAPERVRQVLSDWDIDSPRPRAEVLRLDAGGLRRITPASAG